MTNNRASTRLAATAIHGTHVFAVLAITAVTSATPDVGTLVTVALIQFACEVIACTIQAMAASPRDRQG